MAYDLAGATACVSGTTCRVPNSYYSQCLRGAATTAAPPPPPSKSISSASSVTSVSSAATTGPSATPSSCPISSTLPNYSDDKLLNPFVFNDGTPVQTKEDFTCRQQQILALIEGCEAGALPGKPQSVTASFTKSGSGGTLTITVQDNGKSISFAPTLTFPSGTPPTNGWPLAIAYEGGSIPIPAGVCPLNSRTTQTSAKTAYRFPS
jgi:hypothetical protein